jgi:predicted nucleotidyltransferase
MNVLAEILSSKVRAEFFRILFGTDFKEYYLRDIQRKAGFAIGTVQQEAAKLFKLSLVNMRRDGNRTYYKANKDHPLYPDIHNLVLKTYGLTDFLKMSLSVDTILYAFVFGSFATGTENAGSDVDLFIIGDIGLRSLSKLLKEPGSKISREINPHIMSIDEFTNRKKEKEHFVMRVIESPKIFIIGREHEFARLGE